MTPGMFKPPWHFCLCGNAGMWGACKEKEGREKGRTGAGAVKREGRSGTGVFAPEGRGGQVRDNKGDG